MTTTEKSYATWRTVRSALRGRYAAIGCRADARIPRLHSFLVRGLTIFLFHEVTDSPSPMQRHFGIFTPPALFVEQIGWLRERFTLIDPTHLRQLGGAGCLPEDAGLVTFDDTWSGVFRFALPLLERLQVPSISFVNMATVRGDPDLTAVRAYEGIRLPPAQRLLSGAVDESGSSHILARIRDRYATSSEFLAFQGGTATELDLARTSSSSFSWLGSHLYHHWEPHQITPGLFERSLKDNQEALSVYPNSIPVYAVPGGYPTPGDRRGLSLPRELGYRVVMTATGRQNADPDAPVLDRLPLPIVLSTREDWWHACHRVRTLGWALRE